MFQVDDIRCPRGLQGIQGLPGCHVIASTTCPSAPVVGAIWYDESARLTRCFTKDRGWVEVTGTSQSRQSTAMQTCEYCKTLIVNTHSSHCTNCGAPRKGILEIKYVLTHSPRNP